MIEPIMYVAIGFLVACMLVIGIIPVVHARAVRLTTRRLEAVTPMSMAEIQADKDQLRAEFAMTTRRLEMSVDQMKAKTTTQLAELGKKSEAIGRIKLELTEKTAALDALEAKEKQLTEELIETQRQRDEKAAALEQAERHLEETRTKLATTASGANDMALSIDSQRIELVTARAQIEVLKVQLENVEKEKEDLQQRLAGEAATAEIVSSRLAEEAGKADNATGRIAELERLLIAQTTEAEVLGRQVQELVARIDEQDRFLIERDHASETLHAEAGTAQKVIADLRAELADAENRRLASLASLEAERAALANQLKQAQAERDRLQNELTATKREIEATWAAERMENAVLRERINDVAAEVARLTSVLEGPGSPIGTMLADAGAAPLAPAAPTAPAATERRLAAGDAVKGSLADRIRALQMRASQVPQPGGA
ncbi:MAG: hypothetical protein IT536_00060 [Hyphomicrobiales bacterium]|nr:hypothetical protein [Hyphomicrobiales bacterium]